MCVHFFFPSTLSPLRVNNLALPSRRPTSPRGVPATLSLDARTRAVFATRGSRVCKRAKRAKRASPSVEQTSPPRARKWNSLFARGAKNTGKLGLAEWCNWVNVRPEASLEFKCASPFLPPRVPVLFFLAKLARAFSCESRLFAIYFRYMHSKKML